MAFAAAVEPTESFQSVEDEGTSSFVFKLRFLTEIRLILLKTHEAVKRKSFATISMGDTFNLMKRSK